MTDSALLPPDRSVGTGLSFDKADAFRRARRHSTRVRLLRIVLPLGAFLAAAGVIGYAFFDPFRAVIPSSVSIDGAGLNGTKVTMARPKMAGYRKDGRPYDFVASSAVQDLKHPNVLELNDLDAHVTLSSNGVAHITAKSGIYDSSAEVMDLKDDIHILSDSYDVRMNTAHIEFKGGNMSSDQPVTVVMKTGTVSSDTLHMTNNASDITFEGHVRSTIVSQGKPPGDAAEMKGTTP